MDYYVMPTDKIQPLHHCKKMEKDVIGGLCRCVAGYLSADTVEPLAQIPPRVAAVCTVMQPDFS